MVREAPRLHVLATSREVVSERGRTDLSAVSAGLPTRRDDLAVADILAYPAAQLFVERIAQSSGPFQLSAEEAPLVADICRRLDGIALAIELAAGRVNAYGIAGTASLLDSRFSLQWRGRRTAIPRHQTLSAALDWSYDLLPASESATCGDCRCSSARSRRKRLPPSRRATGSARLRPWRRSTISSPNR